MDQHIANATTTALLLDATAIASAARLPAGCVRVVDEIDSTNAHLMRAPARAPGLPRAPVVLVAARQSAGRGRRGRRWVGDASHGLAMSLSVERLRRPGAPVLSGLSPAIGVALAETLARESDRIGLKWPNDLYRGGRKFAGVLLESRALGDSERVVIGVGLNWALDAAAQQAIDQPAIGLFDALPPRAERERIAGSIVAAAIAAVDAFFLSGVGDAVSRWARFDQLAGREVAVTEDGVEILRGIADGLDETGALRVLAAAGVVLVAVGDVSVRAAGGDPGGAARARAARR
ncbi:MAG: biotin--[acetyl-CoA-carboxylase] ligase [Burkholderiaceae bacterium]|nr:biotin--[acetyl-CoA-carboxylase] ligase [Burkholderiaceae bacterium]